LPDELRSQAIEIVRDRYADFGPTLACEKLFELPSAAKRWHRDSAQLEPTSPTGH